MSDLTPPFHPPRTFPRRAAAARSLARALSSVACLAGVAVAGCEKPSVRWLDAAPLSTTQPSPFASPSAAATDTGVADGSALASFLLTQDLLREAGGMALVASHLDSTPAAAESLTTSAAVMPMTPVPPAPLSSLGSGDVPTDPARCARSLRITEAPGRGSVAVWWSKRDRERVVLLAAWRDGGTSARGMSAHGMSAHGMSSDSTGGAPAPGASAPGASTVGAWRGPIVVDSVDQGPADAQAATRGAVGCARPAPSVAVDTRHGYVHVAYALVGPEGPGVFYAHQMDPRSGFEPPQAIVYGARIGAVRVAAAGDVVAVAYEDPNSAARTRIAVAISRTSGHLFAERLTASSENENARDPYVAVRGRAVVVGWSDVPTTGDTTFRVRRARVE
jgi:hypothetical protein